MADPYKAVEYLLQFEGGYANHPADRGGETHWGISSRSHPDVDIANLTREQAVDLYIRRYWDRYNLSLIEDQEVANKLFSTLVWQGPTAAVKALQRALRALGTPVREDGVLGPVTARTTNLIRPEMLLPVLRSEVAARVREIAVIDPSQRVFLRGWLRRAYA